MAGTMVKLEMARNECVHRLHAIEVRIRDGVVALEGEIRFWAEKRAILGAVGHARGVQDVDDRIRIRRYD